MSLIPGAGGAWIAVHDSENPAQYYGTISQLSTVNSTAVASANTAIINQALANAGYIIINQPGTYYVNAQLVLYSNSNIYISPGVTIKQVAGTLQTRLFVNNALVNNTPITVLTLTSDATVLNKCTCVCSAAHGISVGEYANVSWANERGYNGNFQVDTVTTTNVANDTFTYYSFELPENSSGTPVTTASVFNQVLTATVSGATKANPCVVTINTGGSTNPFSALHYVSFSGVGGMTQLNGNRYGISAIGGSSGAWTITLGDLEAGTGLNSTAFSTFTSGGTVTLLTKPLANIGPRIYSADVTTIMVRKCDTNIRFVCHGTLDKSDNNTYGDAFSSCVVLGCVQGGEALVDGANNTRGWPLYTSGISDFTVHHVGNTGSYHPIGGFQNVGFCRNLRVKKVMLTNVIDNVCTFSNYDGAQYVWQNGITCGECDYYVEEASSENKIDTANVLPFLIFGVTNFAINATYEKLRGSMGTVGVGFAVQPDVIDTAGPYIRELDARDIHITGASLTQLVSLQGTIKTANIGVAVEGINMNSSVRVGTGAVIDTLNVTCNSMDPLSYSGNSTYGLINLAAGTIRNLNVYGSGILTTGIGNPLITNAAKVGSINVVNAEFVNFAMYTETTGASNLTSPYSRAMSLNFNNSYVGGQITFNNAAARALNFAGNAIAPTNKLVKHLGAGALNINSAGNDWSNMSVGQFFDTTSNGLNVQVYGADIFVDPAVVTTGGSPSGAGVLIINNTQKGQSCNSGNATALMGGFSVCTGVHWYAIATGAAAINTQITGT